MHLAYDEVGEDQAEIVSVCLRGCFVEGDADVVLPGRRLCRVLDESQAGPEGLPAHADTSASRGGTARAAYLTVRAKKAWSDP